MNFIKTPKAQAGGAFVASKQYRCSKLGIARFSHGLAYSAAMIAFLLVATRAPAQTIVPWTMYINTNNIVNVTNYGAVGDGVTTNTMAISNAIVAAAAGGTTNGLSGGTVEIPAGVYLSGPLVMASYVNLQIDGGAILRMLPLGQYPGGTNTGTAFISGTGLQDIEISGPGAIDGQGAAWWPYSTMPRASMITPSGGNGVLIQNITLSNSPEYHISISDYNVIVQNVTVQAPGSSPNTDGCDVSGTNILIQNCNISDGDDDYAGNSGTHDVVLTNNTYGTGHGISIGSDTSGGVSNILVINCTMNGTENGLRIKSDNTLGGLVQNINYFNISMTNVGIPIQVYSYYNEAGTPNDITPAAAAAEPVAPVSFTTPVYRNITYSNITATGTSGNPLGIIWARTELPATNIVFEDVNITGNNSFDLYNVSGAQFIDCNLTPSSAQPTFEMFDAQAIITNSAPTNTLFSFNGVTTNGYANALELDNAFGTLQNTNCFGAGTLTLNASTFTVSNNLTLFPTTLVNFTLGTNAPSELAVVGNLALGGTSDIFAGAGYTNGIYTLMTYTGTLSGSPPVLGATPSDYNYAFDTSTAGEVNLDVAVATEPPPAPTGLTATAGSTQVLLSWTPSPGASGYIIEQSTTNNGPYTNIAMNATNSYMATGLTNGTTYYYVVSATNVIGDSANSSQASATPEISAPTGLTATAGNGQVLLGWTAPAGATGYLVERANVSGGTYAILVTNATTSYVDNAVTNGITYYYVVDAVATNTQSANSSQVSATPISTTAHLLLYEGFAYTNTINLTNNGGTGWFNAWNDKTALTTINAATLSYTDGNGNVLLTTNGSITLTNLTTGDTIEPERLLGKTSSEDLGIMAATNSGVLWMSFFWEGLNTGGQGTDNNSYRQATMQFYAHATTTAGSGSEYVDLGMPNINDTNISPNFSIFDANVVAAGTSVPSTAPIESTVAANTGSALFVLAQMTIDNNTNTPDTINVWLNPPLGVGVGGLGSPNITFDGQDLTAVNALRFQSSAINATYNVGGQMSVDEFRLGNSLASVTPIVINTAPVLSPVSNQTINVGVNLLITNTATDASVPAQTLTFSLPVAPTNAMLTQISSNGIIDWQPVVTQANSTNPFSIVVTGNGTPSMSATQSFNVTVNPLTQPVISVPVLTNGQIGFSVSGQTGPDYAVEDSTNLVNWSTLFITNSPAMPFSWSTNLGTNQAEFYQIKTGPPLP